jgi:arabinan endo-1,5-alpha-L-arabinosidase
LRKFTIISALAAIGFWQSTLQAQPRNADPAGTIYQRRQMTVHDPVITKEANTWYLFCTGFGISCYSSTDLITWKKEDPVLAGPPQWATLAVPGYKGHTWAPDISYYNGMYHLYYSVSTFGKNRSAIGLAANKTLDPKSPNFGWTDLGPVVESVPGRDRWNAIGPNLAVDEQGTPWLCFGSFWDGIKLVKLQADAKTPAHPQEWYTLASRTRKTPADTAGNMAVEAPFIFKKSNYYYLFVSWDQCCKGQESTYKVMVCRSQNITGPYTNKNGVDMTRGGGSLLLQGDTENWYATGHSAVYSLEGKDLFICHGYDRKDNGKSKLIIREIVWDEAGWPVLQEEKG